MDTGYYPLAATEMKVKMMSRQANWAAAGVENPDTIQVDDEDFNIERDYFNDLTDIVNAKIEETKKEIAYDIKWATVVVVDAKNYLRSLKIIKKG